MQSGWGHSQANCGLSFAMAQLSLQNSLPSGGTQLQSEFAHLAFTFIEAPFFNVVFINRDKPMLWCKDLQIILRACLPLWDTFL